MISLSSRSNVFAAFILAASLAGGNAVAIRISNAELAPFWGAATRFLAASLALFVIALVMRLDVPRGRALVGVLLYGILSFGSAFGFIYWALIEVSAGTAMVGLATVPMLTLLFANLSGIERLTLRGCAGAILAAIGIFTVFGNSLSPAMPVSFVALILGAASLAASPVVVKTFPKVHAVSQNAIGMLAGSFVLFAASALAHEQWTTPVEMRTWMALVYLIFLGSIAVFLLILFLLRRLSASATNYIMLLAPLSATVLGALLLGEEINAEFLMGSVLVLLGVYFGAVMSIKDSSHPSST